MDRRERKKQETRQRLLRAAWELFQEGGYDQTTVADITEAADVAKGTFFNYFATKEAIVEQIAVWRVELLGNQVLCGDNVPSGAVERIKVLLQAIELRHAPFMLWITDLSAPDRLWAGLNLPYLGGIPVLTLLMGGSMFLQQRMTPSPADPTQAKIMMFLPVIFTFMFLNFASGLVLYWLVNNLLSIGSR